MCGGEFSLAEAVAAPWVERMLLMLPYWRNLEILRLLESQGLTRTAAWMRAVAARPSVLATSAGEAEMVRASRLYYVTHASPGSRGEATLGSKGD